MVVEEEEADLNLRPKSLDDVANEHRMHSVVAFVVEMIE